jgi:DNA-binding IclR family transcriptional regulator
MNPIRDRIVGRVADDGAKVALLTVLARQPRRSFSSTALGQYLPLPQSEIDRILRGLVDDGFLECLDGDGETSYRLTRHPEVRQAVLHLAGLDSRGHKGHVRVASKERQRA